MYTQTRELGFETQKQTRVVCHRNPSWIQAVSEQNNGSETKNPNAMDTDERRRFAQVSHEYLLYVGDKQPYTKISKASGSFSSKMTCDTDKLRGHPRQTTTKASSDLTSRWPREELGYSKNVACRHEGQSAACLFPHFGRKTCSTTKCQWVSPFLRREGLKI